MQFGVQGPQQCCSVFPEVARLTPLEFGNLQKMDGPTEQCQDPNPTPQNCSANLVSLRELRQWGGQEWIPLWGWA